MSEKVYKVGETVRIRKDLKKLCEDARVAVYRVIPEMLAYSNKVATITSVSSNNYYTIDLDKGRWLWWDDCFLETLEENDLVEVPQWFDEWYNTLKELNVTSEDAKLLAIHKISQQSYGCGFTDPLKILGDTVSWPWDHHSEEDLYTTKRGDYVNNHKLDLISAVLNGYTVIKDSDLYNIPLPYLITSDGQQQYLSVKGLCTPDISWFASRKDNALKQTFAEYELDYIPSGYKQYAKKVQDD